MRYLFFTCVVLSLFWIGSNFLFKKSNQVEIVEKTEKSFPVTIQKNASTKNTNNLNPFVISNEKPSLSKKDKVISESKPTISTTTPTQQNQDSFENPDILATGIVEDNTVISIGEYIPVPLSENDITNTYDDGEIIEIGEYLPIDEESLLASQKEYKFQKSLGLNTNDINLDYPPLLLDESSSNIETESINIGEYIPVDESLLPN